MRLPYKDRPIVSQCMKCGKDLTPRQRHARQQYCSKACAGWHKVPVCRCKTCGRTFKPVSIDRMKYCSRRCSFIDISSWQNREYKFTGGQRKDHYPNQCCNIRIQLCSWCGKMFTEHGAGGAIYCSDRCRYEQTKKNNTLLNRSRKGVKIKERKCKVCGTVFKTYKRTKITCSDKCSKIREMEMNRRRAPDQNRRRRARLCGAMVERFKSAEIFKRDGYRCQICGKLTNKSKSVPHPRAPTIDHIIPLCDGGSHERKNVQCACFHCNCKKSGGVVDGGEQLLMFGV